MGPRRADAVADNPPPAKRPRAIAARNAYPRRRAITACQLCRMRKTKCDNRRPSCGTCTSLEFQCVYQDTATDFSSFDPASLAILDRVNYAIQLIEQHPSPTGSSSDSLRTYPPGPSEPVLEETPDEAISKSTENSFLLEAQQLQANCASSRLLQWPSLRDLCEPCEVDKLFFNPAPPEESTEAAAPSSSRGIREEDVPSLIQSFLENVHTKNPILDPNELRNMSRYIGEDGFQWNGPSCLILIACALGTISRPFSIDTPGPQDTSRLDARDYTTSESYYTAARKRIGLLDSSIIAIQCAFLIGVFEMYSMRPLRAWLSFNRACTYFQTYLHSSSLGQPVEQSSETVRSRLYWSCLKSDCEMREEIALPPTELTKVEYSDAFPSPPGNAPDPDGGNQTESSMALDASSERSWYYYLSEIASRRIANRVTAALHPLDPEEWVKTPVHHLQRIAEELDAQVVQWAENFPPIVRLSADDTADELSYYLHSRYLDLRERIWRPFLYLGAHSKPQDPNLLIYVRNAGLCLDMIFKHIHICFIRHRHHGSWFAGRSLFTKGLLVLVAARSPNIAMPANWMMAMDTCITGLRYWEDEAPDLRAARLTLQRIYQSVNSIVPAFGSAPSDRIIDQV
ncbi:hypothetical protein BDW59DRAFT_29634 [Aspergillus cavernicola]|uniref:Zn(2)-C6 fungal-type domain-containing protein n=1 Tax=Aspergillus cavernicola TaxID=176166 RepID=A0ABR4IQT5_9EURO